jgi:cell division protein ZapA (FtsZ GTPase activity inhibitor)
MKEQISIKVTIAGKIFPLKVAASEEENIRKAAELINNKLRTYTEEYSIKDKQAALSMSALEIASELLNVDNSFLEQKQLLADEIAKIERVLS